MGSIPDLRKTETRIMNVADEMAKLDGGAIISNV
jgi:hypothetical protein